MFVEQIRPWPRYMSMRHQVQVITRVFSASPVEGLVLAAFLRRADEVDELARARDRDADLVGNRADALAPARRQAQVADRTAAR